MSDSPLDVTMGVPASCIASPQGTALGLTPGLGAPDASGFAVDTTRLPPTSVNADTPTWDLEETNSTEASDSIYKYIYIGGRWQEMGSIYKGRWQESVAYIGGVGRRA